MLTQPPTYSSLIERHGLSVVAKGGDFVLTPDGYFALTKDGDVQNGSIAHNAMFRLTEAWRLNAPSLRLMYDTVRELRAAQPDLENEVEAALGTFWWPEQSEGFEAEIFAYHTVNDE